MPISGKSASLVPTTIAMSTVSEVYYWSNFAGALINMHGDDGHAYVQLSAYISSSLPSDIIRPASSCARGFLLSASRGGSDSDSFSQQLLMSLS